ncbi:MAG: prolipoprotein diacylglyceryl transferase [Bacillota bacterium]|jgi:phosphatidylglycerol:prolipoprotein diacylglycerol transferase|nr:prolipoprotein diacylglyceryl transferase [Bacillota bacterium]HHU30430.1 prolipoprotein diacylglyceryl transferase [Bacillota bacterium]
MYPVLFQIGGITVYSYGVMLSLAFAVCAFAFLRAGRKAGLPADKLADTVIVLIIAVIVGSRLLYVLFRLPVYRAEPLAVFRLSGGGMSFFGGLAFGIAAGLLYARRHGLPGGKISDLLAPYLAIGYAIARVGCLLNGCCYGRRTSVSWAVASAFGGDAHMRHPTQIYAIFAAVVIFFILQRRREKITFDGRLFIEFLILYCLYRFAIEYFRETDLIAGFLTWGQIACLALAAVSFLVSRRLAGRRGC